MYLNVINLIQATIASVFQKECNAHGCRVCSPLLTLINYSYLVFIISSSKLTFSTNPRLPRTSVTLSIPNRGVKERNRVAMCLVFNRTVRYLGSLSGIKIIVSNAGQCMCHSSIFCATDIGTVSVRYF